MFKKEGIVVKTFDSYALVTVKEHGQALDTNTCEIEVKVLNPVGAKAGDTVLLKKYEESSQKISFTLHFIPIAALFLGASLGYLISKFLFNEESSDIFPLIFAFLFLWASFPLLKYLKDRKRGKTVASIIQVI